jgi:hypothetical protein
MTMARKRKAHLDFGTADMLGLDDFGAEGVSFKQAVTSMPFYGALAGAAIQTAAAIGIRNFTSQEKYSEAIGGAVGVATGAVMIAFPKTAEAGWTCLAVSLVSGGLRTAERMFATAAPALPASDGTTKGYWDGVQINPMPVMQGVQINPMPVMQGVDGVVPTLVPTLRGVQVENRPVLSGYGNVDVAARRGNLPEWAPNVSVENRPVLRGAEQQALPVQLVGVDLGNVGAHPANPGNIVVNGPQISGLGSHFGSTHFANG